MAFSSHRAAFRLCSPGQLFRSGWIGTATLAVALCSLTHAQIPAPSDAANLDRRFLGELDSRQLYDLATDFARNRLRRSPNREVQAFWIDQLSAVSRRRMWNESAVNRRALTKESIESITVFQRDHIVSPETSLALRLSQIEGLLNLARINRWLHEAGHRGPAARFHRSQPAAVLPFLDRAAELAESLLHQLQENRGALDRRRVHLLRERAKNLAVGQSVMRFLTDRATTADHAPPLEQSNDLRNQLKSLQRAARLPSTRQTTQRLLAELQLAEGDYAGLELNLRHRKSLLSDSQRIVFGVQSLLQQGKATVALQRLQNSPHVTTDYGSELTVLRLESLLVLRTMADELQDRSLIKRSDEDFARFSEAALSWQPSVWRDGVTRVLQRYQLVVNVGAEAAALIEKVETLRASGQSERAFQELQRAIRLLPSGAPVQYQAAIQLRMAELCVSRQNWDEAFPLLQRAEDLFTEAERSAPASTAALLSVFVTGQQWRQTPADEALKEKYLEGLIQHRNRWPEESTYRQSTEWLVKLTQQIDPLYAAEILAQDATKENPFVERVWRLIQLGEQLERARQTDIPSRSTKTWSELVRELQVACDQHELTTGPLTEQSARLLLLQASLSTNAETSRKAWEQLHQRLAEARATIADIDPVTQNRLSRLLLVATARVSTDAARLQRQQQEYVSQLTGDLLQAAYGLTLYFDPSGSPRRGDLLIASTLEQLLASRIRQTASVSELLEMIELTRLTVRAVGDRSIRNELLEQLLKLDLTPAHAVRIAAVLMESSGFDSERESVAPSAFWNRIHTECKEGTDLWLESCLQLARLQARQGKTEEAVRRLRVTSVIYPEWGSEQRRRRVEQLLRDL